MTDSEIVKLYRERSERAIEESKLHYGSYILAISRAILGDIHEAEEVENDTYYRAWNQIPPKRPEPLKGFLGAIARCLSLNRREEKYAKKRNGRYALVLDELSECIGDSSSEFSEELALSESIDRFLRAQPEDSRRIFIKRYWYFCSIEEISAELGIGKSKVKMRLLRSREELKRALIKDGFDL